MTTQSFILVTGAVPTSGEFVDIDRNIISTVFYRFSGLNSNSSITFDLEARDVFGNGGYFLDSYSMTGLGTITNMATFTAPVSNKIRGNIRSIISGGSGYMTCDCANEN